MPARKKTEDEDILDIESLLNDTVKEEKVDPAQEKADLLIRIEQLEKQLKDQEVQAKKLSTEEKKIAELEKQLQEKQEQAAIVSGKFEDLNDRDVLLFHVLQKGLLSFGRVFNTGDEIEVVVGSDSFNSAKEWLPLVFDPEAQLAKWGKIRYALGPSPVDPVYKTPPTNSTELDHEAYRVAAVILRERNRKV